MARRAKGEDLMSRSRSVIVAAIMACCEIVSAGAARAAVVGEPMPKSVPIRCELRKFKPAQIVRMIYDNVTRTSAKSLDEMAKHFSPDIDFTDPVTSTHGWPAYRKVYEQFITADQLYYKVLGWSCNGRTVHMDWVFGMKNKYTSNQYVEFEGVSRFVVGADDLIVLDHDSWNEVPPGYASALRSGKSGGVDLSK
jgi:hypothetical protein